MKTNKDLWDLHSATMALVVLAARFAVYSGVIWGAREAIAAPSNSVVLSSPVTVVSLGELVKACRSTVRPGDTLDSIEVLDPYGVPYEDTYRFLEGADQDYKNLCYVGALSKNQRVLQRCTDDRPKQLASWDVFFSLLSKTRKLAAVKRNAEVSFFAELVKESTHEIFILESGMYVLKGSVQEIVAGKISAKDPQDLHVVLPQACRLEDRAFDLGGGNSNMELAKVCPQQAPLPPLHIQQRGDTAIVMTSTAYAETSVILMIQMKDADGKLRKPLLIGAKLTIDAVKTPPNPVVSTTAVPTRDPACETASDLVKRRLGCPSTSPGTTPTQIPSPTKVPTTTISTATPANVTSSPTKLVIVATPTAVSSSGPTAAPTYPSPTPAPRFTPSSYRVTPLCTDGHLVAVRVTGPVDKGVAQWRFSGPLKAWENTGQLEYSGETVVWGPAVSPEFALSAAPSGEALAPPVPLRNLPRCDGTVHPPALPELSAISACLEKDSSEDGIALVQWGVSSSSELSLLQAIGLGSDVLVDERFNATTQSYEFKHRPTKEGSLAIRERFVTNAPTGRVLAVVAANPSEMTFSVQRSAAHEIEVRPLSWCDGKGPATPTPEVTIYTPPQLPPIVLEDTHTPVPQESVTPYGNPPSFDTSTPEPQPTAGGYCGNGVKDDGEECDGDEVTDGSCTNCTVSCNDGFKVRESPHLFVSRKTCVPQRVCCKCAAIEQFKSDCATVFQNQGCDTQETLVVTGAEDPRLEKFLESSCGKGDHVVLYLTQHGCEEDVNLPIEAARTAIQQNNGISNATIFWDSCNVFGDRNAAEYAANTLRRSLPEGVEVVIFSNQNTTRYAMHSDNTHCTPRIFSVCRARVKKLLAACHPEGTECTTDIDYKDEYECLGEDGIVKTQVCVAVDGNENNNRDGTGKGTWRNR